MHFKHCVLDTYKILLIKFRLVVSKELYFQKERTDWLTDRLVKNIIPLTTCYMGYDKAVYHNWINFVNISTYLFY